MSNYTIINNELYNLDDELYHHGVKGMRWGVRRYKNAEAHNINADIRYNTSTKKQYKLLKYLHGTKRKNSKVGTILMLSGFANAAYTMDQLVYGGKGAKATKTILKKIGRTAINVAVKARGAQNIRWYDI